MDTEIKTDTTGKAPRNRLGWRQIVLIIIVTAIVTVSLTTLLLGQFLFRKEFTPVRLKPKEEQVLNSKLQAIGMEVQQVEKGAPPLQPERYSEAGAKREIAFNERELNAMLAKNTNLAQKLAIDLSNDLVSAKLLIPLDPDFPVLGGKTLRVSAGVELAFREGRPVVVLKGVSVMGVPIPNAWLGNLKNIDLVKEFGGDKGFWKAFADGVEYIHVEDGRLLIKLKE